MVIKEEQKLKKKILEVVEAHGWHIHPKKDLTTHARRVVELGGICPCNQARTCPCPEAREDIMARGACICSIVVDDSYLEAWGYTKSRIEHIRER